MNEVKKEHNLNVYFATNDEFITFRQIGLYIRFVDLRTKTIVNMVEKLSVNIFNGIDFMNKYVASINLTKRRLEIFRSRTISILFTGASDKLAIATASVLQEEHRDSNYPHESETKNTVRSSAAEQTPIKWNSMEKVLVVRTGRGLMYFEQDELLARCEQLLLAK